MKPETVKKSYKTKKQFLCSYSIEEGRKAVIILLPSAVGNVLQKDRSQSCCNTQKERCKSPQNKDRHSFLSIPSDHTTNSP